MPILEITTALAPVAEAMSVLPTQDVFSWVSEKGAQADTAIKVIISVALLIGAGWLLYKTKLRVGGIIGAVFILGLAWWLTLGGGYKFGAEVVDDTVTSSAEISYEIPSDEA